MIFDSESAQMANVRITVRSICAQNEGSEVALRVLLENGAHREERRLVLTTEQYLELKPMKGDTSEEYFECLESAAELCRAIRAGEHLLSYGGNTVQTLTQKLIRRGFSRAVAMEASEKLQAMGLIDETRDLQREFDKCLKKLWGAKRINAHLWSKGFGVDAMEALPVLLEGVDFVSNCVALIEKHYGEPPRDTDEQRRMISSLCRYGYSLGEIREAIRRFSS